MSASKNLSNSLPLILLLALASWTSSKTCQAQELRRYQPNTATLSPYLNLGRFNNGGLPNYYALVRPQNRQRQVNFQTQRLQRQQAASLQQLGRVAQPQGQQANGAVTGTGSRFLTSGSRGVYQNTLQFYPAINLPR